MRRVEFKSFEVHFTSISKSFIKSCVWLVTTVFFGSLPLLLVILLSKLGIVEANDKAREMYNDLFLLFLSSAMISEISFEGFLCKIKFSKYSYLFFSLSAGSVIGIACILYPVIFLSKNENIAKLHMVLIFQLFVISYTIAYSLYLKTMMFIEEDKMYNKCYQYS